MHQARTKISLRLFLRERSLNFLKNQNIILYFKHFQLISKIFLIKNCYKLDFKIKLGRQIELDLSY